MITNKLTRFKGVLIGLLLLAFMAGTASAAEYWLWVDETTLTMPDGVPVTVWGFGLDGDNDFATPDYTITVPGPVLTVPHTDATLTIHLKNMLPSDPVSLHILGQRLTNSGPPTYSNGRVLSFTHEAAPGGGTADYIWGSAVAPENHFKPGTFMLQSGTNPAKQVQMGLYAPVLKDASPGAAYPGVPYDKEVFVVFHELDPMIHAAIAAGTYGPGGTITSSVHREAKYFLINGKSHPDPGLNPVNGSTPLSVGERVLLRFINAGLKVHTPQLLNSYMTLVAEDGGKLLYPRQQYHVELPPAKTVDAIFEPAEEGTLPLLDGRLTLTNAGAAPGGMLAYLNVQGAVTAGPFYFSTTTNTAVPGVAGPYDDADIYSWDGIGFSRIFDASAAGLPGNADIDGLQVVDQDTFYISFRASVGTNVPGLGIVDDEDIVLYDAGTWSWVFDGSDVGLDPGINGENVDAFAILADGRVVISTPGNPTVPGVSGVRDEDLLLCEGTFGANTTCTWSLYFDGSDVALNNEASEDIDGAAVSGGNIYLSALGAFTVSGLSGDGDDIFVCNSPVTGSATSCASFTLFFDGSANGLSANEIDAIDLP